MQPASGVENRRVAGAARWSAEPVRGGGNRRRGRQPYPGYPPSARAGRQNPGVPAGDRVASGGAAAGARQLSRAAANVRHQRDGHGARAGCTARLAGRARGLVHYDRQGLSQRGMALSVPRKRCVGGA
ncbi:hypothetical protein G6F31_019860 [Rhizopus arrhizus]|nr:hypothetical protein G6F31_019860 [Rhizopus arrhizus]